MPQERGLDMTYDESGPGHSHHISSQKLGGLNPILWCIRTIPGHASSLIVVFPIHMRT
jgi:hypothetical protein